MAAHEKPVKSVCENGEALIPVLQDDEQQSVKDDLGSIKIRYENVKNETSARQASLVEALLLSQQFRDIHKEVVTWLDRCEENFRKLDDGSVAELQQERIKVAMFKHCIVQCYLNAICYVSKQTLLIIIQKGNALKRTKI